MPSKNMQALLLFGSLFLWLVGAGILENVWLSGVAGAMYGYYICSVEWGWDKLKWENKNDA